MEMDRMINSPRIAYSSIVVPERYSIWCRDATFAYFKRLAAQSCIP
jgi:hypothetical protein